MPIDYGTNNVATSGNVNVSGLITATSGNFTNFTINNSGIPIGSGSNNYVAKWVSSNTISSGILYDNGTGIGVGTQSPSGQFHVIGTGYFDGVFNADNLRIDSNTLSSSDSNGAITVSPNGTGNVQLTSANINVGGGAASSLISTTSSASNLILSTNNNSSSSNITIQAGTNGNIIVAATGTGNVNLNVSTGNIFLNNGNIRIGNGAVSANLTTTSSTSNLILSTNANSNSSNITVQAGTNGNVIVAATGTGNVNLNVSTGNIFLNNGNIRIGNGATSTNLTTTSSTSNLILSTNANTSSANISIQAGTNGNVIVAATGTGNINLNVSTGNIFLNSTNIRVGNGSATTNIFTTNSTSNLKLATNSGTSSATITINAGTNGGISISTAGTGALQRLSTGNTRGQHATELQAAIFTSGQIAGGNYSSIGGGYWNTASGTACNVDGGSNNTITSPGSYATIGGGASNNIRESYGTIGGGGFNVIGTGCYVSTIGGGSSNEINKIGDFYVNCNTIAGGTINKINATTIGGRYNTIGGGYYNSIDGDSNVICGGGMYQSSSTFPNQIVGSGCVVCGGRTNTITANYSSVLGGEYNTCEGNYSSILGGNNNTDGGYDSVFILGTGIVANQSNTTYVQNLKVANNIDIIGNITANNGVSVRSKTLCIFTTLDNQPPATGFATIDTRNSIAVLDFDDSTSESGVFVGVIPDSAILSSGVNIRINWTATTATSGNCRWGAQFERMNTDIDTDSFDSTVAEASSTTNATCGIPTVTTIACTGIDSLTAGDFFRLKIYRAATDAVNDTMTGDAELIAVEVRSLI